MQRFNLFNPVHKALRAMLYDAALSLQQTCFADAAEAKTVLQKVEAVLNLLEQHAHYEATFILPSIIYHNPWLANEFEKEHATDGRLCSQINHLLNMCSAAASGEARMIAGSAITKAFIEFMVFNLEQMAKEEIVLNQALWLHYTDAELMQLNQTILMNMPEAEKAVFAQWMLRGVNKAEASNWLQGIRQQAPEPDFWRVYSITKPGLPLHRRIKVQEALLHNEAIY